MVAKKDRSFQNYMNQRVPTMDSGGDSGSKGSKKSKTNKSTAKITYNKPFNPTGGVAGGGNVQRAASGMGYVGGDRPSVVGGNVFNPASTGGTGGGGITGGGGGGTGSFSPTGGVAGAGNIVPTATTPQQPNVTGGYGTSALAKAIQEASYGDAWSNPDQLTALWFDQGGYSPYGGGYSTMQDMAGGIPLQWLLHTSMQDQTAGMPNYLDYANNYLNAASGAGRIPGGQENLAAIFNPEANSTADRMLRGESLSRNDQIGNYMSTIEQALQGVVPTPVIQAMLDSAQYAGQQFGAAGLQDPNQKQNFGDYLLADKFSYLNGIRGMGR